MIKTTSVLATQESDLGPTITEALQFGVEVRLIHIENGVAEVDLVGTATAVENYSSATRSRNNYD